ncbi:MAG TPA: selenoneine biosynthesis selenosugar synthase SenB [Anaeromyxobacteraceae bacterium]|nr:selenoneine biosynthesis selenosugar synthase SenB [Anaeromyxobacteraceae bacterium]
MRIVVATPASRGSHKGNRVTALRWAGHLRALGHRVRLVDEWDGQPGDVLVALHATKSHPSAARWRARRPDAPLIVSMAGTDLYQDLPASAEARRSLALATRITVLQPLGIEALPAEFRSRARAIVQSARAVPPLPAPSGVFQACLLAHLRAVKDPCLAAAALRRLPARSRLRVVHLGAPLDPGSAERARAAMAEEPRYSWRGDRPRREALGTLAGSAIALVTSRLEGGSNAVSEALAAGVPVLSTRVDGSVGVLGPAYPGLFPAGDAEALARLLLRVEEDEAFLASLRAWVARLRPLVEPAREREAWRALLAEVAP